VLPAALEAAKELAGGPSFAHAMTKKMLHQEWNVGVDEAIEMEAQAQAVCMQTKDFHRAYEAFAAKRKPTFEGN
jgi:enoyl-CoA hydratase/carnithine racemase